MANPDGRPSKEVWVGGPYKNLLSVALVIVVDGEETMGGWYTS